MPGNSFGQAFRITTFGESHGPAIGAVIDGCPPGLAIDEAMIQAELDRRRPGQSRLVTQRVEADQVEILSGIFEGHSTGTPIALLIRNADQRSKDYEHLRETFRPSHADFTYQVKYGLRDHRGGGRSSARETAARVAAGAIARELLQTYGVSVHAWVSAVEDLVLELPYSDLDLTLVESNPVRCPDPAMAERMATRIAAVRKAGDTVGGTVSGLVRGCPAGLGEPVFSKLHADLAGALMGINATRGFEYGSGFEGTRMRGSTHNDLFTRKNDRIGTASNRSGGVQGGISNGEDIYFRLGFKPVATILRPQSGVDASGEEVTVEGRGRHDPCVLPRAVPIVEAMTLLVLADHLLRHRGQVGESAADLDLPTAP